MSWRATSHFYGQLRSLLKSGMAIDQSLRLAGEHSPPPYKAWSQQWAEGCRNGQSLSELMAASGERAFPTAIIAAGEHSGRMVELCDQIIAFYDNAIAVRRIVIGRSIYPLILLHVCLLLPLVVLWFWSVIPGWAVFSGVFGLWTLIGLGWAVISITRASGLASQLCLRKPLSFLAWPLITSLTCRVLQSAAAAGMLWPDGLRLAAGSCANAEVGKRLRSNADRIDRSEIPDLPAALVACGFQRTAIDLIAAAEHAGSTEDALHRCAELHQESFSSRMQWTAKVTMGTFYGCAIAIAAATILGMAAGYAGFIAGMAGETYGS